MFSKNQQFGFGGKGNPIFINSSFVVMSGNENNLRTTERKINKNSISKILPVKGNNKRGASTVFYQEVVDDAVSISTKLAYLTLSLSNITSSGNITASSTLASTDVLNVGLQYYGAPASFQGNGGGLVNLFSRTGENLRSNCF